MKLRHMFIASAIFTMGLCWFIWSIANGIANKLASVVGGGL